MSSLPLSLSTMGTTMAMMSTMTNAARAMVNLNGIYYHWWREGEGRGARRGEGGAKGDGLARHSTIKEMGPPHRLDI